MNRAGAISAAIGVAAAMLLVGAYFGAPYAGFHLSPSVLIVLAAGLAFGSSVTVFTQSALAKPAPKPSGSEVLTKRIRDLDPSFVTAFPADGRDAVRMTVRPDTKIDMFDVVKTPSSYAADKKILVTIKKSPEKTQVFNPILLKALFVALKERGNFLHILLVNHHDEYLGYIPAFYARTSFTGDNGESLIRRYIVDVLSGKEPSDLLRGIGGLSARDWISSEEKVSKAMERIADGLLRGLVVLQGGRHRRPTAIVYSDDLIKATTPKAG